MRTLKLCTGALVAMALVALGTAHADIENAGTTAANFLSLGTGARTLSMGGATLGLGDDVGGAGWNAAALGWVSEPQAMLSHAGLQNKSLQEWGTYGSRVGASRTRWAVTGIYQGDGSFEGRDASGISTGSFSVSSMAFGATVAQKLGDMVSVGLGTKFVTERLGVVSGSGVTLDGGIMFRAGSFGLGFAAQNLGGHMSYGSAHYPFPTSYGGGISYANAASGLRIALDGNLPNAYHPDVRAGVEWTYRGLAALRTGYRKELSSPGDPLTGATFGIGAGHNNMWMDYGYLLSSNNGGEHRLALRFNLGHSAPETGAFGKTDNDKPKEIKASKDSAFIGPRAKSKHP